MVHGHCRHCDKLHSSLLLPSASHLMTNQDPLLPPQLAPLSLCQYVRNLTNLLHILMWSCLKHPLCLIISNLPGITWSCLKHPLSDLGLGRLGLGLGLGLLPGIMWSCLKYPLQPIPSDLHRVCCKHFWGFKNQ